MKADRLIVAGAAVVSLAAAACGGVALASGHAVRIGSNPVASERPARLVRSLRAQHASAPTDAAIRAALKAEFADFSREDPTIAAADFEAAQPAPIAGETGHVWIASSGGNVCTFIPDPVNGWGGGCSSTAEVAGGEAYAVLGGPSGGLGRHVIVAVVVPDGGAPPELVQPNGNRAAMVVSANVAAAIVPAEDELQAGAKLIELEPIVEPTKVRWVHG